MIGDGRRTSPRWSASSSTPSATGPSASASATPPTATSPSKPEVIELVQGGRRRRQLAVRRGRADQGVPAAAQGARPRGRRADRQPEGQAVRGRSRAFDDLVESMYEPRVAGAVTEFLESLLRGVGIGSVYAILALGFVIIYKATRVISFAQPAFMLTGAVVTSYLTRRSGSSSSPDCRSSSRWPSPRSRPPSWRWSSSGWRCGRWWAGRCSWSRSSPSASTSRCAWSPTATSAPAPAPSATPGACAASRSSACRCRSATW